jgi:ABC-type transporter Mla subunit MlaD
MDLTEKELREQYAAALDNIAKLERQVARTKELYDSAIAVVRRLQAEREGLIDRVEGALRGIEESREKGSKSLFSKEAMRETEKLAAWHRAMHGEDD